MKIVVAGGGTGGHLFPGMAVAEEFRCRDAGADFMFIGTERGLEKRVLPGAGYDLRTIDIEGIKGRGFKSLNALAKIPGSLFRCVRILREFRPDIVIGVGGYASGPAVAAAVLLGIKTAVAEQNAFPGLTNRILGKIVDRVFLTFPDKNGRFSPSKVIVSGNPVRAAFCGGERKRRDGSFTVLIFGGSQGARSINRAMIEALPLFEDRGGLKIVHQTGAAEYEKIAAAYSSCLQSGKISWEVLPFISDMASAYNAADLLICRAGATSIAEITACGKAAVLIPFPYAVADHQTHNARVLAEAEAAILLPERDLTPGGLAALIGQLRNDPERLARMEAASMRLGNVKAAAVIVDECMKLIGR